MAETYPLSIVLSAVDRATGTLNKVSGKLGGIGKAARSVGRGLTSAITLPIAGVGIAATKMTADFEKSMSNVSTLIDTNTESLDAMGKKVLDIAAETPVAVEDLTSALYDVRSAGVSAADQFDVLEGSARLAVAGLGSTKEAVDLVTSATNAFGLEGEDAAGVYDQIFKAVKFGKTDISQLATGFGAVAGQAAATGTQFDEYIASVSALTTTGQKASQSHTQMRAVMSGLTRDTTHTRKVFRALGAKDFKDLIKQSGGLVPALRKISEQVGGDEAKILQLVGSTEALNAILGLTGKQAATFNETLAAMRTGANAVDEAFEKQNKTTAASMQRAKNAMMAAAVTIGETLAPYVVQLSEFVADAAKWFRSLDKSTQGWILKAAGIAAIIGPAVVAFGALASAIGVVLSPIGLVVGLLATAATMIMSEWEYFEQFFKLIWDNVGGYFKAAWKIIGPIVGKVIQAAKDFYKFGQPLRDFVTGSIFGDDPDVLPTAPINEVRRKMGLAPTKPKSATQTAHVILDINNAPPGSRTVLAPESDADVNVGLGIAMPSPLLF